MARSFRHCEYGAWKAVHSDPARGFQHRRLAWTAGRAGAFLDRSVPGLCLHLAHHLVGDKLQKLAVLRAEAARLDIDDAERTKDEARGGAQRRAGIEADALLE